MHRSTFAYVVEETSLHKPASDGGDQPRRTGTKTTYKPQGRADEAYYASPEHSQSPEAWRRCSNTATLGRDGLPWSASIRSTKSPISHTKVEGQVNDVDVESEVMSALVQAVVSRITLVDSE